MVSRYVKGKESEARVLEAIYDLRMIMGYGPSYREIGEHIGLATSAVHGHVKRLYEAGLVYDTPKSIARTLRLTAAGHQRLRDSRQIPESAPDSH